MPYDVMIVGGGPAGLAAALTFGRARKHVLLCDAPPARNAAAVQVHNFVTRDGVAPAEFRRIAREQLTAYPRVEVRDERVEEVRGQAGAFDVRLAMDRIQARRVLLCTGMIDEMPDVAGFGALWGKSIFICPYCHAWEVQDRRFAYLATSVEALEFAVFLRGWSGDVIALTDGRFAVPDEIRARLASGGVGLEERRITRLVPAGGSLATCEFDEGSALPRDVLFVHPRQRQVDLVRSLSLALDAKGYVQLNDARETSLPGIYAAGDLVTPVQAAILAAAAGTQAAAMVNHALTVELALGGALV
jgi:thioredoxin reductase